MKRSPLTRKTPLKAKKGLNKVRKTSKSTLKRKADKLFSEKIREIGECWFEGRDKVRCGGSLQCMHIIGRANHNLRWDESNAICGCAGHHRYYTSHAFEFYELLDIYDSSRMAYLRKNNNLIWDKNIEAVLEQLK